MRCLSKSFSLFLVVILAVSIIIMAKPVFAEVTQLWSSQLDMSIVSSPIVANGFVYVTTSTSGGSPITLYCLDSSSGAKIWNHTGEMLSFTVANDFVYVSEGGNNNPFATDAEMVKNPFASAVISCLNAHTGAQVWSFSVEKVFDAKIPTGFGRSFGNPVVDGNVVYVGGYSHDFSISVGFVYAFNALTGTKIWNYTCPVGTAFKGNCLAVSDTKLYVVGATLSYSDSSWNSNVYAFNASTGEKLWNYGSLGRFSTLAVAGQSVYISSNFENETNALNPQHVQGIVYQGGVRALNSSEKVIYATRRVNWDYAISSSVNTPIISANAIYAVSGGGNIYALNISNGRLIWSYPNTSMSSGNHAFRGLLNTGTASLANGYLYAGSSTGVYCFNATDGELMWNFTASDFGDSYITNPTYADGIIYVGWNGPAARPLAYHHNFYALNAWNGEKLWNYTMRYKVTYSPTVINGTVYIGASSVTDEPSFEKPGAVLALNSTVASLPQPTSTAPTSTTEPANGFLKSLSENPFLIAALIIMVFLAIAVISTLLYRRHRTRLA
jgi:outer membrane protein assembly factor BamB